MTLGSVIREARERLGWTQSELADQVGVDPSSIAKLEKDVLLPRQDLTRAIARLLVLDGDRLDAMANSARKQRVRTRGRPAAVVTRGAESAPPEPPPGRASSAEEIGRAILDDADLKMGFLYLRAALADPTLKPAVLTTLQTLAEKARPPTPEDRGPRMR